MAASPDLPDRYAGRGQRLGVGLALVTQGVKVGGHHDGRWQAGQRAPKRRGTSARSRRIFADSSLLTPGRAPESTSAWRTLDRPGDLGVYDPWEDAESCQHSASTPMSCANAR